MTPTVPNKDSNRFLLGLLFQYQESSSIYQSISIISRSQKMLSFSDFFIKLRLGYNPKTPTPFINQFVIIFRETESLLPRLMISGKQIWWTLILWLVLTRDTNFYSHALMYFRNLLGSYHLKTKWESL